MYCKLLLNIFFYSAKNTKTKYMANILNIIAFFLSKCLNLYKIYSLNSFINNFIIVLQCKFDLRMSLREEKNNH